MPAVADLASAAGRLVVAALLDTFHPHLAWIRRARLSLGTCGPLGRGSAGIGGHIPARTPKRPHRSGMHCCPEGIPGFTGGQAGGLGDGVRAEEALGTPLAVAQAARPSTPRILTAAAQPLGSTGVLFVSGRSTHPSPSWRGPTGTQRRTWGPSPQVARRRQTSPSRHCSSVRHSLSVHVVRG